MSLGLSGCGPREPEVFLSESHPALPSAVAGRQHGAPAALRPELQNATPRLPALRRSSLNPSRFLTSPKKNTGGTHSGHKMPMGDSQ